MASLADYSNEELGALVRRAAQGREQEAAEALHSQYGLAEFLNEVGLTFLAELIAAATVAVWEGIKRFFSSIFY